MASREANRKRYERDLYLQGGKRPYVDGTAAGNHVRRLMEAGMSRRQVEFAAGVDYRTVANALEGRRMQQAKAEAILAVRPKLDSSWCYVPAEPTLDRVDRMWRQGYSLSWISGQIGHRVPKRGQKYVRAFIALEVKRLSDFVGDSRGQCRDGSDLRKHLPKSTRSRFSRGSRDGNEGVMVDTEKLARVIGDTPYQEFEKSAGLSEGHLRHVLERGACTYSTLAKIASRLAIREDDIAA